MSRRHTLAGAALAGALALSLAACTNAPEPSPTPSPTASATPSATPTPASGTSSPTPEPTPEPTPTPATPVEVSSGWQAISPAAAGVVMEDVREVVGAWKTPGGGVVSIVKVPNTVGSTDPKKYFDAFFSGVGPETDEEIKRETRTADNGDPVLMVTIVPAAGLGGDGQVMFFVLGSAGVVSGFASADPADLTQVGPELWELVRVQRP